MDDLLLRGLGHPAFLPQGAELLVRHEVGFIRAQSRLLRWFERQLLRQLDLLWPGAYVNIQRFKQAHPDLPVPTPIIQSKPLARARLRVLLAHCPNPYALAAMSDEDILALFRQHMGRAGPALLDTLRTWFQDTVLLPEPTLAPLASQLQRLFSQLLATETLIEDTLGRLIPLLPQTPARHLPAIPGLGDFDAARYLAGIGSIDRFHKSSQVWALAGFDPIVDGSGDHPDRTYSISRHGDPFFRDTLFQMGFRTALHYPPVALTFFDACDRGKSETEATIHAAHKVNRICFHLMQNDEPFVDQSLPGQWAQIARRRKQFLAAKKKRRSKPRRKRRSKRRR